MHLMSQKPIFLSGFSGFDSVENPGLASYMSLRDRVIAEERSLRLTLAPPARAGEDLPTSGASFKAPDVGDTSHTIVL